MKWFKHDSDANHDARLKRVRMKYGMEGYGLYWYCLELIAKDVDVTNLTFELEHDAEIISHDTGIHVEMINEMMAYMVNQGLFENAGKSITCMKMAKRLDQSMTSNYAMRKVIDGIKKNHDPVMTKSGTVMRDKTRLDKTRIYNRAAKRAPKSWKPSDEGFNLAAEVGMDHEEYADQLAQFMDHEFKTARKDWDACWRTWCRNWKKWSKSDKKLSYAQQLAEDMKNVAIE